MNSKAILAALAAIPQLRMAEFPLWRYLGPNSNTPYQLTAEGRRVLGLSKHISKTEFLRRRDKIIAEYSKEYLDDLAAQYASGKLTPRKYTALMRTHLKDLYTEQYLFSVGGRNSMLPQDWGSLGSILRRQYSFLDGFEKQLLDKPARSYEYMVWRQSLYANSSRYAFERGHIMSWGMPRNRSWGGKPLPVFPAEPGATLCGSNCGCSWSVHVTEFTFECTWMLDDSKNKHCETCLEYAQEYSPLTIARVFEFEPYDDEDLYDLFEGEFVIE